MTVPKLTVGTLEAGSANATRQTTVLSAALVIMLGAFVLFGVALAQPTALHDAAHDTRHGFSFPCH